MKKYFIVTVDTEEDNQWSKDKIETTDNLKFLMRFQNLCEKYGIKPVYFCTYGVASNNEFVKMFKQKNTNSLCEIGMHMHAWNCPPFYENDKEYVNKPFITEYSAEEMNDKIKNLTMLLTKQFETPPISSRSGRWALNDLYIEALINNGYKIDCSVTPYINWSKFKGNKPKSKGTNYKKYYPKFENKDFLECPMTIVKKHRFLLEKVSLRNVFKSFYNLFFGETIWLRPKNTATSLCDMKMIAKTKLKNNYIMFMIHSSELMPHCNPTFINQIDVDNLYNQLEQLFKFIKKENYQSITLKEYFEQN